LLTREHVASLLEVEVSVLTWWVWALAEERRYTEFTIQKRNGDQRVISAPIKPIKDLQRRLATLLLDWFSPPARAHGFLRGRDPRSNAGPHRRQQWVLKVDLADFFGTINFRRVRGLFMAFPFEFRTQSRQLSLNYVATETGFHRARQLRRLSRTTFVVDSTGTWEGWHVLSAAT
jgi:RNA-directed DNA polymerase